MKFTCELMLSILTLISLLFKSLSLSSKRKTEVNKFEPPVKRFKRAALVIIDLNMNKKGKDLIPSNPRSLEKFSKLFVDTIYIPKTKEEKKEIKEAVDKISTKAINDKLNYYKMFIKDKNGLTEAQKLSIAYYIGNQNYDNFLKTKDYVLKKELEDYILKIPSKTVYETEYARFIEALYFLNEENIYSYISPMDKIYFNLVLNKQISFHKYFTANVLPLIKTENKQTSFLQFPYFKAPKRPKHPAPTINIRQIGPENIKVNFTIKESQIVMDALRSNVKKVNERFNMVSESYESAAKFIDKNQIFTDLKSLLQKVENSQDPKFTVTQKLSSRAEILSLAIKIKRGEGSSSDVISLTKSITKEFGTKHLYKPAKIAETFELFKNITNITKIIIQNRTKIRIKNRTKNIINIIKNITKSITNITTNIIQNITNILKTPSYEVAEIFVIVGNLATLSPAPVHNSVGNSLLFAGKEIKFIESIQKVIDNHVDSSVKALQKSNIDDKLAFSDQIFADIASIDNFIYEEVSKSPALKREIKAQIGKKQWKTYKPTFIKGMTKQTTNLNKLYSDTEINALFGKEFKLPSFQIRNEIKHYLS